MCAKALKWWAFLVALSALGISSASATGDLSCRIDDGNLTLTLLANTNREHGTIVNVHNSSLTLKSGALAMAGRTFKIEADDIIQQWFLQREVRIAIQIHEDKLSMLLVIMGGLDRTQGRHIGRYVVELSFQGGSRWTAEGAFKGCSAG